MALELVEHATRESLTAPALLDDHVTQPCERGAIGDDARKAHGRAARVVDGHHADAAAQRLGDDLASDVRRPVAPRQHAVDRVEVISLGLWRDREVPAAKSSWMPHAPACTNARSWATRQLVALCVAPQAPRILLSSCSTRARGGHAGHERQARARESAESARMGAAAAPRLAQPLDPGEAKVGTRREIAAGGQVWLREGVARAAGSCPFNEHVVVA